VLISQKGAIAMSIGPFKEIESAVRTIDTIKSWKEESQKKRQSKKERIADEVLANATILVEAMNEYANGYRRICGRLQDFQGDWSGEQRNEAEAAYREWLDSRIFEPAIFESLRELRTTSDQNATVAELVECASDFVNRSVAPLISAKNKSVQRPQIIRSLHEAKTYEEGAPVRRWAARALGRINITEAQLRRANETLGRLRGELRVLDLPVLPAPLENVDRSSWLRRMGARLAKWRSPRRNRHGQVK
jgi:hypothetical protein